MGDELSFFDQANPDADAVTPAQVTTGSTVGTIVDGFKMAWDATVKDSSTFGIQEAMRNKDDAQVQAMKAAGIEDVPSLSRQSDDPMRLFTDFGQDYLDTAKFYEQGGDPAMADRLTAYDTKIKDLQTKFPQLNLQNSQQMWDSTRQDAIDAETQQATRHTNLAGAAGEFLGGLAGGMNPNTSPLNFATLPFGGVGKSVVARIGEQALVQGGAQTLDEFNGITGVGEQRKLLGLEDDGAQGSLERIGQAALGGALAQGVGEVAALGIRRVFRSTPSEPVPDVAPESKEALPDPSNVPPGVVPADPAMGAAALVQVPQRIVDYFHEESPWSTNRAGRARTAIDLDYMKTKLDAWDGSKPWEIAPDTNTAAPPNVQSDFTAPPAWKDVSKQADINATMRRIDPDTMGQWDQAADEKKTAQIQLTMAAQDRDATVAAQQTSKIQAITDDIARLDAKIANVGAMKAKWLRGQRDDLVTQRDTAMQETTQTDSPSMAVVRQRVMAADEKMRDLAPLVTRAKVKAQGKWEANEADHEAVVQAMRDGRKDLPDTSGAAPALNGLTLPEKVPLLQRVPEFEAKGAIPKDADAIDAARIITADDVKTYSDATEAARARLSSILKEDGEPEISVAGYGEKLHLDNDRMHVEQADGSIKEMSLREALQSQLDSEEDLKAVSSCSIL